MDINPEFICPRPRNPRACDKCRARKVRCLPAEKGASRGTCRRCTKFGYTCSYATPDMQRQAERVGTCREKQPSIVDVDIESFGANADIISGLCESKPPPTDGLNELLDFHHRAFSAQSNSTNQPEFRYSYLRTLKPTDSSESRGARSPKLPEQPDLTMHQAESLLTLFRQREAYFPFITIPSSTTARSMAITQPFLLLAILTVSSSRTTRLQQRTDERFRRVLSERIILHGEKSLDYVRGLLVYIAWYPLHLRPTKNQTGLYMQIAKNMVSELGIDRDFDSSEEERGAYLGCCVLSSFVSGLWQRPGEAKPATRSPQTPVSGRGLQQHAGFHLLKLQDLATRVASYKPHVQASTTAPPNGCLRREPTITEEMVIEQMTNFSRELEDLLSIFPVELRNSGTFLPSPRLSPTQLSQAVPTRLATQFIKLNIAYIPLKHHLHSKPDLDPISPHLETVGYSIPQLIHHAKITFAEIQSFLNTFLSIPNTEYSNLSIREWSQLILTVSIVSNLVFCASPAACPGTTPLPTDRGAELREQEWNTFQIKTRTKMLVYLETLRDKFKALSVSTPSHSSSNSAPGVPDAFCMLHSVLGVLVKNYTLTSVSTSISAPSSNFNPNKPAQTKTEPNGIRVPPPCTVSISETHHHNPNSPRHSDFRPRPGPGQRPSPSPPAPSTSPTSRCPILNGSIQETEYWRALEENNHTPGNDGINGLNVDDLVNHPQDWARVFGEWIVDLDFIPE